MLAKAFNDGNVLMCSREVVAADYVFFCRFHMVSADPLLLHVLLLFL